MLLKNIDFKIYFYFFYLDKYYIILKLYLKSLWRNQKIKLEILYSLNKNLCNKFILIEIAMKIIKFLILLLKNK